MRGRCAGTNISERIGRSSFINTTWASRADAARCTRAQVVADGRDEQQPRLAELALDIELAGEAVAAVGVDRRVRRVPGGLRGEELRHIGLSPALAIGFEEPGCFVAHEARRLKARVRLRERELDALVRPDRPSEHDALRRVGRGALYKPVTVPERLGRDEDALAFQLSMM